MKILALILFTQILISCSLIPKEVSLEESVNIKSEPLAADIYDMQGEFLGRTPLTLTGDKLKKTSDDKVVTVLLKRTNYQMKEVVFYNQGVTEIKVNLKPIDQSYFEELLSGKMSNRVNDILKKIINTQTNILSGKLTTAESDLNELISKYPTLSSTYVLQGVMDIKKKNFKKAKLNLKKALSLDEGSDLAKSYLNYVESRLGE